MWLRIGHRFGSNCWCNIIGIVLIITNKCIRVFFSLDVEAWFSHRGGMGLEKDDVCAVDSRVGCRFS